MKSDKIRLKIYLAVFIILLSTGTAGFMLIENFSLTDAVYFSIVTMATVGYGDLHPQSDLGKLLALVIIVGGVSTFLGVIASITDLFVNRREEFLRHEKLNMVTGLFFSEIGNELLKYLSLLDPETSQLIGFLKVSGDWGNKDYENANKKLEHHSFIIDSRRGDISELRQRLQTKAELLLSLIANPVIQEHENFTDLLRAIFHLRDELLHRSNLIDLPVSDRQHLEGDIARIYRLLIFEWLRCMHYLQENYKYLFSLGIRLNPFDPDANAVVTSS